ncbi:hypothetical protein [Sphaerisporangium corydalis]|uniref:Uncharacterized protein n=1 Tax=Sphaerisporangium corydalis TaxID=1441875 RepID=A0ABV9EKB9_9ACTN|nr:hypothetical protein [Sphaerisporangium corydalis]
MSHHGTKPLFQIKSFLTALVERADRTLCADQDGWALRLGWTVTRTGFGARRYRDPRFDALRAGRAAACVPAAEIPPTTEIPERRVPADSLEWR